MIFHKDQMSDAEYVEQVRKRIISMHRARWIWPIGLVIMSCLLLYIWLHFPDLMELFPDETKMTCAAVMFGSLYGFVLGQLAFGVGLFAKEWIQIRRGFRTERLMLQYHDELKNKDTSNQPSDRTR